MTTLALTTQNRRQLSEHAGRCRHFLVTRLDADGAPGPWERVDLALHETLHEMHPGLPAALAAVNVLITRGAGPGLAQRLARSGVQVMLTDESDPQAALQAWLSGALTAAPTTRAGGSCDDAACHCGH